MEHPLSNTLHRYLVSLEEDQRLLPSTLKLYRSELNRLLKICPLPSNTALKIHLREQAPATQWRKAIIWRAFLNVTPSPWTTLLDGLKLPRIRQKQPTFLSEDEAFRIEAICYKTQHIARNRLLVGFALQLGLRLGEILSLKFSDCEAGGWLRIIRKGGKEQRLPLTPTLQTLISFWRSESNSSETDWIFMGRGGEPMSHRTVQLLLKDLTKRAGIEKRISPHSLRHTFATTLASHGANLAALKELLGHQKISTTERYLHVTPAHLRETLSLLQPRAPLLTTGPAT